MSELTEQDLALIEHLKRCIIAAGIFRGLEANNIAATQDAINKISKAFNIDLSVSEDRMKFQEGCRKAAISYLESEGLIEAIENGPDKVRYRVKSGKEQEYKDAIFLAGRQAEYSKHLSKLIEVLKSGKDLVDTIRKVCQVVAPSVAAIPITAGNILGSIAAVAQHVTDISDSLDAGEKALKESFKAAAKEASEVVYKTTERDENFKRSWELAKKVRDSELFKMKCESVNKIQDAKLTKYSKVKAEKKSNKKLFGRSESKEKNKEKTSEHLGRRKSILALAADAYRSSQNNQMEDLFGAFVDVDTSIRPNGPAITMEDASPEAVRRADAELKKVNLIESAIKVPGLMKDQVFDVNPQVGFLHKLSFLKKNKEHIPPKLYNFLHSHLAKKEAMHYEKIQKKNSERDDLEKVTINIAHFNATNEGAKARGSNYACEYAGLTLYRCGKSEILVEAMDFFRMDTLDKIWAISYMKAGMMETLHGVRYMGRQADANGIRYESSVLDNRAEDIFSHYTKGKSVNELDAICKEMSDEFVAEHKAMLDRISERRQKEDLPELQEITYITEAFNNAKDKGEKDHLDVEVVEWKDVNALDATDLYENKKKDGYFIKDPEHESVALFLFAEDRGIVALVDDYNSVTDMKLTTDSYHRYTENREVMKEQYVEPRDAMTIDKALKCIAKDIDDLKGQEKIQGSWRPFVKDAIKNDFQPKCYNDGKTTRLAFIDRTTGVSMLINEKEPNPGYQSASVIRFAKEIAREDYRKILSENNISIEQAERIVLPNNRLNPIQLKILDNVDKKHDLIRFTKASLQFAEKVNVENILNPQKREAMAKALTESISDKDISKLKVMQMEYQHRYSQYKELVQADPVLARCKIAVPDCERDGDLITATTSDGNTFSINTQTMAVQGFSMDNQEMKELYSELSFAIMMSDNILEDTKDIEMDAIER